MDVVLIDIASDPLTKLYGAYRTCYTPKTPREVWEDIAKGEVSREKIAAFVEERLKTGHVSPLEQVVFWFGISGVSRSLSHQFVRHRIGISFEQQSQRYVRFTGKNEERLEFVMPDSWRDAGREKEFEALMSEITRVYREAVAAGIPAEDARFVLPNAAPTNFQIMVNFAELLHIGDLRLCTRAQWEIRQMVAKMRTELMKRVPELARYVQPKCGERRMGYCDEDVKAYEACPLSAARPHKLQVIEVFKRVRAETGKPMRDLSEADLHAAEEFREPAPASR
ncbi:MAG TPA: FAD-dependent thymidylate synthase [Myxococcales bacterium]|nr:FAD-dependent thymidylate synthase [Myxococcales bacterium]